MIIYLYYNKIFTECDNININSFFVYFIYFTVLDYTNQIALLK